MGSKPQYLNSAAEVRVACSLPDFLVILQRVENLLGRIRTEYWGDRTLDLDLLLHESETCCTRELTVPHPQMWYRRFVLDPLSELAPEVRHPERNATIAELRGRLLARPLTCAIYGGAEESRNRVVEKLSREFNSVDLKEGRLGTPGGVRESGGETLSVWLGPEPGDQPSETNGDAPGGGYGSSGEEFDRLPRISRFDVRAIGLPPVEAIRQMIRAALGG